jgi:hypothetical protein
LGIVAALESLLAELRQSHTEKVEIVNHRSSAPARVALTTMALLAAIAMAEPAQKPVLRIKLTRGTGKDTGKLFVSTRCEEVNPLAFLGALLQAVKDDGSIPVPKISLQLRDTTVGLEPRKSFYTTADLVVYHRTGKLPGKRADWELAVAKQFTPLWLEGDSFELTGLIGYASMGMGLKQHVWRGTIHILPPEEVSGHARTVGRRAYRLPKGHTWRKADKLPKRLEPGGSSCAYDPEKSLLNIIEDDASLYTFEAVLEALGAVCVWGSEIEPM